MTSIIKIILLLLPLSAMASDGSEDIQEWWDNEYKQKIQPEQIAEQARKLDARCPAKIQYYTQMLSDYPDDVFYNWRLKVWNKRCE